jgi:hypothetical protein
MAEVTKVRIATVGSIVKSNREQDSDQQDGLWNAPDLETNPASPEEIDRTDYNDDQPGPLKSVVIRRREIRAKVGKSPRIPQSKHSTNLDDEPLAIPGLGVILSVAHQV